MKHNQGDQVYFGVERWDIGLGTEGTGRISITKTTGEDLLRREGYLKGKPWKQKSKRHKE